MKENILISKKRESKFIITMLLLVVASINAQSIKDYTLGEYLKTEKVEFENLTFAFYTPHKKGISLGGNRGLLEAYVLESGQVYKIEFIVMYEIPEIYHTPEEFYKGEMEALDYLGVFLEQVDSGDRQYTLEREMRLHRENSNRIISSSRTEELIKNIETHYKINFDLTRTNRFNSLYTAVRENTIFSLHIKNINYECENCTSLEIKEYGLTPLSGKHFSFSILDSFLEEKRKKELEDIKIKKNEDKNAEKLKREKDF